MDIKYETTVDHGDVLFYVAHCGHTAMFLCGGCVIALTRPGPDDEGPVGEVAKFGLALSDRRPRRGEESFAAYVRGELGRRGMRWALPPEGSAVFLDSVGLLGQDANCSERDLCGHAEVAVYDPRVAEYAVSFGVASGLVLTAARDVPHERTLRLFDAPAASNAYSGFAYETDERAFALTQARLTELPRALLALVEGLFDAIPCRRRAIAEGTAGDRVDVVVTAPRAAAVVTVPAPGADAAKQAAASAPTRRRGGGRGRAKRRAAISSFVQVKYIPLVVNVWTFGADGEGRQLRPSRSLAGLWEVYCRADAVLAEETRPWEGLEPEVDESRDKLAAAADALFGREAPIFVGSRLDRGVTPAQKFVCAQYGQARLGLPSCYPLLEHLCRGYAADPDSLPAPPLDCHLVADVTNVLFRALAFAGAAAEAVATADERAVRERDALACSRDKAPALDAEVLLETAEDLLDAPAPVSHRETRLGRLARVLERLYEGDDLVCLAARESKTLGSSDFLCAAIDVATSSAFADAPPRYRLAVYGSALLDHRLREAGLPSFCG